MLENRDVMAANIRRYMKEKGKTRQEVCNALGFPYSTFSEWLQGKKYPRIDKIELMANYFGCEKSDLIEDKSAKASRTEKLSQYGIMPIKTKRLPMLGNIACGEPVFANEEYGEYIDVDGNINADFCLRAKGDSMIGARIQDGDIVFIRNQEIVENGEIAAVLIEDEATLKRVQYDREADVLLLFAENPLYKTMKFSGEDLNKIKILGKAVAFQSILK